MRAGDWRARLEGDLPRFWEGKILDRTMADDRVRPPIHVVPAGQVFAAIERRLDTGPVGEITTSDLFFRDRIHLSDTGNYLVALIHFGMLNARAPIGLAFELARADGTLADSVSQEAARQLQQIAWDMVTGYARTVVAPSGVR